MSMPHSSGDRIKQVMAENNIKSESLHTMRVAARERTINLQNMIILDDPFRQDEEWMLINANGAAFAEARLKLLNLSLSTE